MLSMWKGESGVMKGEVIKEVEKEKTEGFVEEVEKVKILQKSDSLMEELLKLRLGDRLVVPKGTYDKND